MDPFSHILLAYLLGFGLVGAHGHSSMLLRPPLRALSPTPKS